MAIRPSLPEVITVNSESLQTQIRDLLPSQNGFGSELQATNVITPIIDLTAAAGGDTTPQLLQTAISFGGITSFDVENTTSTLLSSTGFYAVDYAITAARASSQDSIAAFSLTDGLATKKIFEFDLQQNANETGFFLKGEFVVFLAAGESLTCTAGNSNATTIVGSTRQIADIDGNLVYPSGFTP